MKKVLAFISISLMIATVAGQGEFTPAKNKFRQLGNELATPNSYRNAAGSPGYAYWQQRADYEIKVTLDEEKKRIDGEVIITYHNNSPDVLYYLWIQLDQNVRMKNSFTDQIRPSVMRRSYPASLVESSPNFFDTYFYPRLYDDFEGGFNVSEVKLASGEQLPYVITYTMMRIDPPEEVQPGSEIKFSIKYWYNINDRAKEWGRSGYEYFEKDDNCIFTIAQFYPRMAVYSDVEGWQTAQFTGMSEFALPFGDYDVKITVPADHLVGATGVLQNERDVLTPKQQELFDAAGNSTMDPVIIVSEAEALKAMRSKSTKSKTWHYKAENVRDFAFASSRRFIWDAMAVPFPDHTVMAMSLYPPEGNPLWEKYSTRVVAHTMRIYSDFTFDYPYPAAWSVHTDQIGMEYPMVSFNGGRPEPDGTYSERVKWDMIGVIIHEVGHNYFPMIVNSDERQWTWMDEGLNTFLQGQAERAWDHDHPWPMGRPRDIVSYMSGDQSVLTPIMTDGELVKDFYANAYKKPATGLVILRETIMGRELFDFAFKQYANQWMFKHPTPENFFRIMEDASGMDLDWFWRGWFFGTDPVDISIKNVTLFTLSSGNPETEKKYLKAQVEKVPEELGVQRNRSEFSAMVDRNKAMADFYNEYDPYKVTDRDTKSYEAFKKNLTEVEKNLIEENAYYCQVDFENIGGMVMPLILKFSFDDGNSQTVKLPAQIWSTNNVAVSKVFKFDKKVVSVEQDPLFETADINRGNNYWPPRIVPSQFELYKRSRSVRPNPMQMD